MDTATVIHNNAQLMALQFVFVPSQWVMDMSQTKTYDLDPFFKIQGGEQPTVLSKVCVPIETGVSSGLFLFRTGSVEHRIITKSLKAMES